MPACEAVMLQVPEARKVAVLPETVQTLLVEEAYVTARPELAVALKVSGVPTVCAAIVPNVMVCDLMLEFTVKLCDTGVAAE